MSTKELLAKMDKAIIDYEVSQVTAAYEEWDRNRETAIRNIDKNKERS